eukprot:PhM_4_TR1734/c0_g1_i4/m.86864
MRSFHLRAFPQRQFARKARRTSSSCPVFSITASSLFSMSTTSSLPISAVAAAWYSTTATRRPLRSALEKHLALLSKGGLDDCTIKLLQDVAVHDDTAQFEVMVEKVHAAVRYKTFYTDSDGPDMLLAEFRTLVAGCRADAPAVQRLLATLTYGQRASMESVKMHSASPETVATGSTSRSSGTGVNENKTSMSRAGRYGTTPLPWRCRSCGTGSTVCPCVPVPSRT